MLCTNMSHTGVIYNGPAPEITPVSSGGGAAKLFSWLKTTGLGDRVSRAGRGAWRLWISPPVNPEVPPPSHFHPSPTPNLPLLEETPPSWDSPGGGGSEPPGKESG